MVALTGYNASGDLGVPPTFYIQRSEQSEHPVVILLHACYGYLPQSTSQPRVLCSIQCLLTCPWAAAKAMTRLNQVGLHLLLNKQRKFRCISVDDCAQTEILVRAQSPIQMPSEVADFPLILSKYAS